MWKRADSSTIQLSKDGSAEMETIAHTFGGKSDVKVSGQWLAKGDKLTLRYKDKANRLVVMQYTARLTGNKLELAVGNGRLKTNYVRR